MNIQSLLNNKIKFHKRNPLAIVSLSWVFILCVFIGASLYIGIYVKNLFFVISDPIYKGDPKDIQRIDRRVPYDKIGAIEGYFSKREEVSSTAKEITSKIIDPSIK